jgi:hypothetical protein
MNNINKLMKYETAGDPISGTLWTRKTREKISNELASIGISISKTTIGKLLKKLDFSLRSNSKKISNGGRKVTKEEAGKRNKQFELIKKTRKKFSKKKLPILSVDAKKKDLIGNFKNHGTRYKKEEDLTNDHDFAHYGIGKSLPYGLFDDERNEGFVYVGQVLWDKKEKKFTSSETPEFAAECIAKWWKDYGLKRYPVADEILILADSGGSNGYRSHMWKAKLHESLCNKFGMKVTVCHYPPGASKWNPIEHRLFSEISKNWQGTPLKSFETVLKYIRTTKTKTGLKVRAQLVKKKYKKGMTISKENFKKINLKPFKFMPNWNYSLFPTL